MKKRLTITLVLFVFLFQSTVFAEDADVIKVEVKKTGINAYNFSVTILHKDTGWDHYANKWEIIGENNKILGVRILQHPHVNEQPFTRNLYGIEIPEHIKSVIIRAHDSAHKYGGKIISVELP